MVLEEQIKRKGSIYLKLIALLKSMTSSEVDSSEASVFHQKRNDSRFYELSVVFWSESLVEVVEDHMEVTRSHLKASGC